MVGAHRNDRAVDRDDAVDLEIVLLHVVEQIRRVGLNGPRGIEDIGFDPVDAGSLTSSRYLEPLAMLYIHLAFRQGLGSNCAFKIMRR